MEGSCPSDQSLMTIFYSGKVNIYQNVPADKANAIMLLLSNDPTAAAPHAKVLAPAPPASVAASTRYNPMSSLPPRPPASPAAPLKVAVKRSQAELPFARKVSLTRFLEKRKERVETRLKENSADDNLTSNEEEKGDIHPCKKVK